MRIENWLVESARKFGSKTALITPQRRMTYAEFDDSSTETSQRRSPRRESSAAIAYLSSWTTAGRQRFQSSQS